MRFLYGIECTIKRENDNNSYENLHTASHCVKAVYIQPTTDIIRTFECMDIVQEYQEIIKLCFNK